jgi:hypothetical protein
VTSTSTLTSATSTIPSHYFKSSATATGLAPSAPAAAPSDLAQWKTPYAVLRKRLPAWGPLTPASMSTTKSISASNVNSDPIPKRIPLQPASNPYPSPSLHKRLPSHTLPNHRAVTRLAT